MSRGLLSDPIFHDADKARKWLESRLWPDGPICPHCGVIGQATLMKGKTTRPGLYQCNACREPFTVTVGTLYERSKIPLNTWLAATQLLMSSKKGMSALQVGRMLGLSKKTAWFLCHRIRESVSIAAAAQALGGEGKIVEADETYFGKAEKAHTKTKTGRPFVGETANKRVIVSLVERGGDVRSFHIPRADQVTVSKVVSDNIHRETHLHTDESRLYPKVGMLFAAHETVKHAINEYARGDVTTNSVEGFFGIFKRGMKGVYQQCSEKHLHRYLAEFDYRYNHREKVGFNDTSRMVKSIPGIVGKRLTYQQLKGA